MKINKGQFYLSKWERFRFHYKRAKGHFWLYLRNRFYWHVIPRFKYILDFPDHVDIEISSVCNLRCPMCYTTLEEFKQKVSQGFMDKRLFRKIIDECARHKIYSIRISLRGEAFLHKDIIEHIRYAKNSGISEVSSLSNISAITLEQFEQARDAGLDWLTISFDGVGQIYEKIRYPVKFAQSYKKIKDFRSLVNKKGTGRPILKIQTLWPAIRDNPKAYYDTFSEYVDAIACNPLIDYLHKDPPQCIEYNEDFSCPNLYQRLSVGSDGKVLMCSNDAFGENILGNANNESLYDIWHGKKLNEIRRLHRLHGGFKQLAVCRQCFLPRKTLPVWEQFDNKYIPVEKYTNRTEEIGV